MNTFDGVNEGAYRQGSSSQMYSSPFSQGSLSRGSYGQMQNSSYSQDSLSKGLYGQMQNSPLSSYGQMQNSPYRQGSLSRGSYGQMQNSPLSSYGQTHNSPYSQRKMQDGGLLRTQYAERGLGMPKSANILYGGRGLDSMNLEFLEQRTRYLENAINDDPDLKADYHVHRLGAAKPKNGTQKLLMYV